MNRIRTSAAALAFGALLTGPLAAQVGRDPSSSPYRDVLHGNGWTLFAEQVGGDGGPLRVSPNSGTGFGIRYDIRFSGLMQGYAGLTYMDLERMAISPDDSVANWYSGPFPAAVWAPEIGLQLNLTGPKTWHRLAPFVAGAMGAAIGEGVSQDTSSLVFGTKLHFSTSAGVRVFAGDRLHLRLEGVMHFWKMKYPSDWTSSPTAEPTADGPIATVDELDDWIPTPSVRLGIGFAF